jgi:hypothetical protein
MSWLREALKGREADFLALLLAILFGLPALGYPFGSDQALHAYIGAGILEGQVPYLDAGEDIKPVGIYLVHTVAFALFGDHQWSIRLVELGTVLFIGWLLARLVRGDGPGWGPAVLLMTGFYYTSFDFWHTAQQEVWQVALLVVATVIAVRDPRPGRRALASGAFCGAAFLLKFTAVVPALGVFLLCWRSDDWSARAAPRSFIRFAVGGAVVVAVATLPIIALGAFDAMREALWDYLSYYVVDKRTSASAPSWINHNARGYIWITAAAAGAGWAATRGDRERAGVGAVLVGMAALAWVSVWAQGRFFPYHWIVVVPFLAGLIVWAVEVSWQSAWSKLIAAALIVALAFTLAPYWTSGIHWSYRAHTGNLLQYKLGRISRSEYLVPFVHGPLAYSRLEGLGLAVRRLSKPGDTLCVTAFATTPVYQVSGLRCPSRFAATHHVYDEHELPWPEEYEQDLRTHHPTFILFPRRWMTRHGAFLWSEGYRVEKRWTGYVLMSRRER